MTIIMTINLTTLIPMFVLLVLIGLLIVWGLHWNSKMSHATKIEEAKKSFLECAKHIQKRPINLETKSQLTNLILGASSENWWEVAKNMSALSLLVRNENADSGILEEWKELEDLFFQITKYVK